MTQGTNLSLLINNPKLQRRWVRCDRCDVTSFSNADKCKCGGTLKLMSTKKNGMPDSYKGNKLTQEEAVVLANEILERVSLENKQISSNQLKLIEYILDESFVFLSEHKSLWLKRWHNQVMGG